jgi:predicted Zn-ribbon and HTH transcriptional regulator
MQTKTTTTKPAGGTRPVIITRCVRCGFEHTALRPIAGNCPRCNGMLSARTIGHPHPETAEKAARNS